VASATLQGGAPSVAIQASITSPAHAQADIYSVTVGAAADATVVAQVDLCRRGDLGGGGVIVAEAGVYTPTL
jgi:hypothetical protein